MKNKLEQNLQSIERLSVSPTESPEDRSQQDFYSVRTRETPMNEKEKSFTSQNVKTVGSPKQGRSSIHKENSFVEQKPPSRAQSNERKIDVQRSPKKSVAQTKKDESKISTWNGRSKNTRPSLTTETYVSPFTRNSTGK